MLDSYSYILFFLPSFLRNKDKKEGSTQDNPHSFESVCVGVCMRVCVGICVSVRTLELVYVCVCVCVCVCVSTLQWRGSSLNE